MSHEAPAKNHLDAFRNPPVAGLIFFLVIGLAGAVWAVLRSGREIVAMCGGARMSPGESCSTRSRRSMTTTEWTYDDRLEFATAQHHGLTAGGVAVAVCAAIVIASLLIRWLRDRAVADTLAGQQAPLTSYANRAGLGTGFVSLLACVLAFFGASVLVQALNFTVRNQIGGTVVGAAVLLCALVLLVLAFPRGSTLVWPLEESVRVVTRSRVQDVAWQQMQYLVGFAEPPLMQLSWTGKAPKLTIDDGEFFALMRDRINQTLREVLPARRAAGETLDFGAVTITGDTVTVEKAVLDSAQIGAVGKGRNDHGDCLVFVDHTGNSLATVTELRVANRDLLPELLTTTTTTPS